jgi:hypothetical protein
MVEKFKILKQFNISTNDISQAGETRTFSLIGDRGIDFILEIQNEDKKYYNFKTNLFQTSVYRLKDTLQGFYSGKIKFPAVTDADKYDVSLFVDYKDSRHATYNEVRNADGTLNINESTGSNSALVKKSIAQTLDKTLTLTVNSPSGTISSLTIATATIKLTKGSSLSKTSFEIGITAPSAKSFSILREPVESDAMTFLTKTVGSAPITNAKEDIYPAVTGTDTVNGAVTSSTTVRMDGAVADYAKVGDRVTGNTALDAGTFTLVSIDATNVFTISSSVSISDGVTLSFSNQRNYTWPITSSNLGVENIYDGFVVNNANFPAGTTVKNLLTTTTIMDGTTEEFVVFENVRSGIQPTGSAAVSTDAEYITTTSRGGNITFSEQGLKALGGTSLKFYAYDVAKIKQATGYDVVFSNIKLDKTPVTTTTTSAVSNSATIPVASRSGIINNISTMSGIGVDPSVADPLITSGATGVGGAGSLTCATAQTLEDGITLTFSNTHSVLTLTGDIVVNETGNEDVTINFDIDKFLNFA